MSGLTDIEAKLKADALAAWDAVKAEGKLILQTIEPVAEAAYALAVQQFGALATQTVLNLMTAEFDHLSGSEKSNLAVTTVVDAAQQAAVTLAETDASALVKNSYNAVMDVLEAQGAASTSTIQAAKTAQAAG